MEIFKVNIQKMEETLRQKQRLEAELGPSDGSPKSSDPAQNRLASIDSASIMDYASRHFEVNSDSREKRWSGRQIRNAFQVAYSLAQFGSKTTGSPERDTVILDWRQFDLVAKAAEKFEDYLYATRSGTDSERARQQYLRADDYDDRAMPQKSIYDDFQNPQRLDSDRYRQGPSATTLRNPPGRTSRPRYLPPSRGNDQSAPPLWNSQPDQDYLAFPGRETARTRPRTPDPGWRNDRVGDDDGRHGGYDGPEYSHTEIVGGKHTGGRRPGGDVSAV